MRPAWIPLLFLAVSALSSPAALPGDAAFRTKEIYTHRQKKKEEFLRDREQREKAMVERVREVRVALASPPWNIQTSAAAGAADGLHRSAPKKTISDRQSRTWIGGMLALFFIGGCVWFVRLLTTGQQGE